MFIGNILSRCTSVGIVRFHLARGLLKLSMEKTLFMNEFVSKGQRCRATRNINAHQGLVKAQTEGTIEFETDNLGRRLIRVHWDISFRTYVFPDEIELVDSSES